MAVSAACGLLLALRSIAVAYYPRGGGQFNSAGSGAGGTDTRGPMAPKALASTVMSPADTKRVRVSNQSTYAHDSDSDTHRDQVKGGAVDADRLGAHTVESLALKVQGSSAPTRGSAAVRDASVVQPTRGSAAVRDATKTGTAAAAAAGAGAEMVTGDAGGEAVDGNGNGNAQKARGDAGGEAVDGNGNGNAQKARGGAGVSIRKAEQRLVANAKRGAAEGGVHVYADAGQQRGVNSDGAGVRARAWNSSSRSQPTDHDAGTPLRSSSQAHLFADHDAGTPLRSYEGILAYKNEMPKSGGNGGKAAGNYMEGTGADLVMGQKGVLNGTDGGLHAADARDHAAEVHDSASSGSGSTPPGEAHVLGGISAQTSNLEPQSYGAQAAAANGSLLLGAEKHDHGLGVDGGMDANTYVVQPGDTMTRIAATHHVPLCKLPSFARVCMRTCVFDQYYVYVSCTFVKYSMCACVLCLCQCLSLCQLGPPIMCLYVSLAHTRMCVCAQPYRADTQICTCTCLQRL
jgi:hypothetical protein